MAWGAFLAALIAFAPSLPAASLSWTNALGGVYSEPLNWSPNQVPMAEDILLFNSSGSYSVTNDLLAVNTAAYFNRGSVTQAISAAGWRVNQEWAVGDLLGGTSQVAVVSGVLSVTNDLGNALLSVGRVTKGSLVVRGGSLVVDRLLATNGPLSLLTFAQGDLTTLHGLTVSNQSKVVLGSATNNLFIWNVLGGMNRIITGATDYGGLTLGTMNGGGRATLNLTGPETILNVPGLDVYGRNGIYLSGGAKLQTSRTQFGLQTGGTNNVVVIDGPGTSWVNDGLMRFGMHSGSQTLMITNGGYFKAGNDLSTFSNPNNQIIVTGSGSLFYNEGLSDFGRGWSIPRLPLNNLLLVTNGGQFWMNGLSYGDYDLTLGFTRPGCVIDVANGSLKLGKLDFTVGTLQFGEGTGTIGQLNINGGTNAIFQARGNLYVGHHGDLGAGDVRIGNENAVVTAMNGTLELGGWRIGALAGDVGEVTMTGGQALVANDSLSAPLVVGGSGKGTLRIQGGSVVADAVRVGDQPGSIGSVMVSGVTAALSAVDFKIGTAGSVVVNQGALLQIGDCVAPANAITVNAATLEFLLGTPSISSGAIATTDATVSFRGAVDAPVELGDPQVAGRLVRAGRTALQLVETTNRPSDALVFRDNDSLNWSRLIFNGGNSALQTANLLIEGNSSFSATNSTATITGAVTMLGKFELQDSTVRFVGPVNLSAAAVFSGTQGFLRFEGGLHLPATDIVVPAGISLQAGTVTSDGGKLIFSGGGLIPDSAAAVPARYVQFLDGWVTYLDSLAAPVTPPGDIADSAGLGLELVRSTNALTGTHVFSSEAGSYARLRLGRASTWLGEELVIGAAGTMYVADTTASVKLSTGLFRVENGGKFYNDSGTNYVGFDPASSNAVAVVSGIGSTWDTPQVVSIGAAGRQNQLRVEHGARLSAASLLVGGGGIDGGRSNVVTVSGGAVCVLTNGLTVNGNVNQVLFKEGGIFQGSLISVVGSSSQVTFSGGGVTATVASSVLISGAGGRVRVEAGAGLLSSNAVIDATLSGFSGGVAEVSGAASVWRISNGLGLGPTSSSSATNRLVVSSNGSFFASSIGMTNAFLGRTAVLVDGGSVTVTNATGTGNVNMNGYLEVNRGTFRTDKLTATNVTFSTFNLRAGRAEWTACDFAAGVPLNVGSGTNLADLNLLGGTSLCRGGLTIRPYSRLLGAGTLVGMVTNRGAIVPSSLVVQGNLEFGGTGRLEYAVSNLNSQFVSGSLSVTGSVSLNGSLVISLGSGLSPSPNQSFVLLSYGSLGGSFSNVQFGQRLLTADRLASFRIDNTGSAIVATDFRSEDVDGDGILDSWTAQYFGAGPLLAGTAPNQLDGDLDGDGISNRAEFRLGSDPSDANSSLQVKIGTITANRATLRLPYFSYRSFTIFYSDDLVTWTAVPLTDLRVDPDGNVVWIDPNAPADKKRFFRFSVE